MIKQEFGPQAVILSARDISKRKGVLGLLRSPGVEVTAATDTYNANAKPKTEPVARRKWTLQRPPSQPSAPKKTFGAGQFHSQGRVEKGYSSASSPSTRERSRSQKKDNFIGFLNLYEELVEQGVEEALASELIEQLRDGCLADEVVEDEAIRDRLTEVLKTQGVAQSASRLHPEGQRVVALVGPTGVGKTTTMAKIAVTESVQKQKEIALLTLNDQRIGAAAQMEAYGKILGVPTAAVWDPKGLRAALKRFGNKDLILIDTPGISHNDVYGISELKALLEGIRPVEVHLLISAATREKDFQNIFRKFGLLPIHCLLFTKVDETEEYGSMLNAAVRTQLPLSYFADGQQIPENLQKGSLDRLIALLWKARRHHNGGSRRRSASNDMGVAPLNENVPAEEVYVANRNSDLFHRPSCKWIERIDERHRLVFRSPREALANNFRPCRACHPASGKNGDRSALTGGRNEAVRKMAGS